MLRHLARRSKVPISRPSDFENSLGRTVSVTARSTSQEQQVVTSNEWIVFNVGGTKFATTQTTLQNAPMSPFASILNEQDTVREDKNREYFIDRDGKHFRYILNFMRDASFNYPAAKPNDKFLLELRAEAQYYRLTGLVELIDRYPHSMTTVRRAACSEDLIRQETDVVFYLSLSVDQPCQLLGVGLCGAKQAFTAELALFEVDPSIIRKWGERPWESPKSIKMQITAKSFTQDDGKIVRLMLPQPALLVPNKRYTLTTANGLEEQLYCKYDCLDAVTAAGVRVHFHDDAFHEFPELYIRAL